MRLVVESDEITATAALLARARQRVRTAQGRTMFDFGARMVETARREFRSAAETTRTATARRTGMLARALAHRVQPDSSGVFMEVGYVRSGADDQALEYAATHEFGARVRAKQGGYLAIPLDAAKTAVGVARGKPRDFENTFVVRTKRGNLVIMQRRAGEQAVPLFALVKSVRIRRRPSLGPAVKRHMPQFVEALVAASERVVFDG